MEVNIGGERLGSGKKETVHLHHYNRSTHDLGYLWRSTMAAGTLVPFMCEVALPGDTFDINLNAEALTHPTIGPLFGQYKLQLDVFQIPIRLYQGKLHMNMLGIGMDMSSIKLPQIIISSKKLDPTKNPDNQQINPSSIFNYLGIKGLGHEESADNTISRAFNAIPYLGYWDIYKQYYANKQEEIGAVIHRNLTETQIQIVSAEIFNGLGEGPIRNARELEPTAPLKAMMDAETKIELTTTGDYTTFDANNLWLRLEGTTNPLLGEVPATWLFKDWEIDSTGKITGTNPTNTKDVLQLSYAIYKAEPKLLINNDIEPKVTTFPLENIDNMRQAILENVGFAGAITISETSPAPYGLALQTYLDAVSGEVLAAPTQNQEGLAIKTYQSDLFNNWMSTEWIDGTDGISAITAIDTTSGNFTIDELLISKKIYDMLNRIAISGGTYDDWLNAVYTEERTRSIESPMYLGGLIKNIVFQEVVSNSATTEQPLGTLAGRGRTGTKHKGGQITAKISEPSYLMGIVSITPLIDYSQGNKWDTNIRTMNDFHKPALDAIGFQDLITDQMAFWDTKQDPDDYYKQTFKSAGKQPAWLNYMTNVNQVKGNFADENQQMFMTLNRRYEAETTGNTYSIKDLTTYIDPVKFNHIFADTRRDAQNFWMQISVDITARRKMSAKIMPNL